MFNAKSSAGNFDPSRRRSFFGALLSLEHILTIIFWLTIHPIHSILGDGSQALCWPHFQSCHQTQPWVAGHLDALLLFYSAMAIMAISVFILKGRNALSLALLGALTVFKAFIILQDLRLGGNYHLIAFFISAIYLLHREPERAIQWMIVFIYFAAGLLKFNPVWLSGAMTTRVPLPESLQPIGAVAVIILELILVWGLLSSNRRIRFGTLGLFALFHLLSWPSTLWFYPSVMTILLSVFVLFPDRLPKMKLRHWVIPSLFLILQIPVHLSAGPSSVTGEGRTWALNMYDGITECEGVAVLKFKNDRRVLLQDFAPPAHPRIQCDPYFFREIGRAFCRRHSVDPAFADLDLSMTSRSLHWRKFHHRLSLTNACASLPKYNPFGRNDWISLIEDPASESDIVPFGLPAIHSWPSPPKNPTDPKDIEIQLNSGEIIARNHSGSILWSFISSEAEFLPQLAQTDKTLIFASQNGTLVALSRGTGQVAWILRAGGNFVVEPVWTTDSVFTATVIAPGKTRILKVDLLQGSLEWESGIIDDIPARKLEISEQGQIIMTGFSKVHSFFEN